MNKTTKIADLLSGILMLVFTYTVVMRLMHFRRFTLALEQSPLFGINAGFFAALILSVETVITLLLFVPTFRRWGFLAAAALMLVFTGYVAWLLLLAEKRPCACGGILENLTWTQHLLLNSFLMLTAFTGWLLSRNNQFFIAINRGSRKTATE